MKDTKVPAQPPTIACVDDEASIREALDGLLCAYGYRVVTFASAEALLEFELLDSVSCLIADIRLGGISGLQLLKELNETGHAIPTIIISAFGENGYRTQAMKAGAVDVLSKPISSIRLLTAVETCLKGHGPKAA
jgi:FixJ family two-component response regulator